MLFYVITVGDSLPVSSCIFTNARARSAKLFKAAGADSSCFDVSFSNFSKYILIVAPADPVPDNLKITLESSPEGYSKFNMSPCLLVSEPSTGSTYPNSTASTNLIAESSSAAEAISPSTNESLIRSITCRIQKNC